MNTTLKTILCAALVVAPLSIAGCKSDEEKVVSYMEEMAEIMDGNKDNCDAMAEKLTKWNETKGKELKELETKMKGKKDDKEAGEAFKKKYGDRVDAATKKILGGSMKCMTNEKVMKAMKSE
jgi:hypothetical protein